MSQEIETTERILLGVRTVWTRLNELEERLNLGFGPTPATRTVYCNRQYPDCLWYFWNGANQTHTPITEESLTGYVASLEVVEGSYKNKPTYTLQIKMQCGDRQYVLKSGYESVFSTGLLLALAQLTGNRLARPITIAPQPGEDEKVLICSVFQGGEKVKFEWPSNPGAVLNSLFETAHKNLISARG